MANLTRIKNNQIADGAILAHTKIAPGTIVGSLFNSNLTMSSDVTISGNLTVLGVGTYLTVASTNTYINDPLIVLNNAFTGTNTYDIGMIFNRGNQTSTALIWNEAGKEFRLTYTSESGSTYGTIPTSSYANVHIGNLLVDYDATIRNVTAVNTTLSGNIAVNGGELTSNVATFNLLNAGVTSINAFGNATITTLGATTGTTIVRNSLTSTGILFANSATTSTGTTTGGLVVAGGVGVAGNIYVGQSLIATGGTVSTGAFAGAYSDGIILDYAIGNGRISVGAASGLTIYNGGLANSVLVSIAANGSVISSANVSGTYLFGTSGVVGTLQTAAQPNVTSLGNLTSLSASGTIQTTGIVYANANIASTSTTTGALLITGGLGVSGNINASQLTLTNLVATNLTGTLLTAAQPNVTSLGNLTSLESSGTIQTTGGIIGYGGLTGTLQTAAQPNVTSLGNLTSLSASGTIQTTGIVYANSGIASTSTTTGALVIAGGVGVSGNINAGNVNATNFVATSFVGTLLTAAQPNVTSLGNLTSLSANGTIQTTGIVYGNSGVSGTLLTDAQPNVTSLGNLTSLSANGTIQTTGIVYGNSGVSGTLLTPAQPNVTSLGNLTSLASSGTIQTTGGIIGYGGLTGTLQTAAQPNVTSVGTLTGLTVSGTTAPNANASINLGSTSNYWDNIYGATIYATNHYGTLQTAAQPNVTSLGNLTSLSANGTIQTTGIVYANSGIASTSIATGALVVNGGVGITGNMYANGSVTVGASLAYKIEISSNPADSAGSITVGGGLQPLQFGASNHRWYVSGSSKLYLDTNTFSVQTTTASNNTSSGALVVAGGVGVSGNINAGNVNATNFVATSFVGTLLTAAQPNVTSLGNLTSLSANGTIQTTGIVYANSGIASTSTTTGALVIAGGVGVSGNINAGNVNATNFVATSFVGTLLTAAQPNVTSLGNLTSLESSGTIQTTGGIIGYGGLTGTLQTAAQPNITSVGTLTGLTVSGVTSITNATNATGYNNGALVVTGGLGVAKDVYIQGNLYVANIVSTTTSILTVTEPLLYLATDYTFPYNFDIGFFSHFIGGSGNVYQHTGLVRRDEDSKWYLFSNVGEPTGSQVTIDSNTVYDQLVTGAHTIYNKVVPSANLASNIGSTTEYWGTAFVGTLNAPSINGTLQTAAQPNVTSLGNVTSLSASGIIQTTGVVYANSAIESTSSTTGAVVIIGGLGVSGNIYAGNINLNNLSAGNLIGTLQTAAQPNVTSLGNLTSLSANGTIQTTGIVYGNSGVSGTLLTTAQPNVTSLGNLTSLESSGTIQTTGGIIGYGGLTGTLQTAAQPNVTSLGNLTSLSANGTIQTTGIVYGNSGVSGTLLTPAQPNVTSLGNLTSLSANGTIQTTGIVYGNSGVSGTLLTPAQPNVTSLGNLTSLSANGTIQTTGIVYGNSGVSGTLLTDAQPNVTSLGNLTSLSASGTIQTTGIVYGNSGVSGTLLTAAQPNVTSLGNLTSLSASGTIQTTGIVYANANIASTSTTTGSIVIDGAVGGLGVAGNINAGNVIATNLTGTLQTAAQPNVTSLGNLTSLESSGTIQTTGGIIGYGGLTGTLQTAAQPNVTSLGNLTSLSANGTIQTTGIVYGNSGVSGTLLTTAQPNVTSLGNLTSLESSGTIQTTGGIIGYGGLTGTLQTAAQPNVTSLGNLTSLSANGTIQTTGIVYANSGIASTSTTTGAIVVNGGIGLSGNAYVGQAMVASGGAVSTGAFAGSYSNGIILDYTTGTGRLSVGTASGLTIYNGGLATTALLAIAANGSATLTGNLNVIGSGVDTTQTTFNVFNGTATTVNAFGAATSLALGATTGTTSLSSANISLPNATTIFSGQTSLEFANTVTTTVNAFGSATSTTFGATTGTTIVRNSLTSTGILYANSATTTTSATTGGLVTAGGVGIGDNLFVQNGAVINGSQSNNSFRVYGTTSNTVIYTNSVTGATVIGGSNTAIPQGTTLKINSTDSVMIPVGTTGQRPSNTGYVDQVGMIRFNTSVMTLEYFDGSVWQSAQGAFTVVVSEQFVADGVDLAYTLGANVTTAGALVSINGVVQIPTLAYAVTNNILTFTEAPAAGDLIDIRRFTTTSTVTSLDYATSNVTIDQDFTGFGNITIAVTGQVMQSITAQGTTFGGNVTIGNLATTLTTAAQPNVTSLGNLTSLSASGTIQTTGIVYGNSGVSGTLLTAAQTNITSVGTLTGLTVSGTTAPSANATVNLGSTSAYWNNVYAAAIYATNHYGTLQTAAQPNVTSLGNLTALSSSGTIQTTGGIIGYGGLTGTLQTAAQPNVTSVGTLTGLTVSGTTAPSANATVNLGSTSAYWNNVYAAAIYATNYYGTLQTAAQPNITSVGTLNGLSVTGNIASTGIVTADQFSATNNGNGTNIRVGDDAWIGDINITNTLRIAGVQDGTEGYIVFGNTNTTTKIGRSGSGAITVTGAFGVTGNINAGNVITTQLTGTLLTAAQPNITSVGTLTGLAVSGVTSITNATNATAFNNGALVVSGGLGVAKDVHIQGNLYVANIVSVSTSILTVTEPLLYLETDHTFPYNFDIGFFSHFTGGPGNVYQHTGFVRNDGDNAWRLFSNVAEPAGSQVTFDSNTTYDTLITGSHLAGTSGLTLGNASAYWGSIYATNHYGTLQTAAQTNITSVGTLTGLTVSSTISGSVSGSAATVTTAAQPNITSVGTLTGLTVSSTITGSVSGSAATVTTAAQPNITSVGTLTGLTVSSTITGSVSGTAATVTTAAQTNITSVGTLTALGVSGAITVNSGNNVTAIVNGGTAGIGNIGSVTTGFNTVFAKATSAVYADLAEKYMADAEYAPGTVVDFGGEFEVTANADDQSSRIAGVVSTNPAYLMNSDQEGEFVVVVALMGRVPVQVIGDVRKGDLMVSAGNGRARAEANPRVGTVIGKAIQDFTGTEGIIEVVVGRV